MNNLYAPEYSRNYGFWNEKEQGSIMAARVAIAGVGGDGFQLGLKLAQMGVQTFDIADPETFEPENANRVPGATVTNMGRNKAEVFKENVYNINPQADVRIYKEGINSGNVYEFTNRATLVFDESELTRLDIGTSLARVCRERGIPEILVMNVGFAALVTSFKPNSKWTFEKFMGIPDDMPLSEVSQREVAFDRCLPYIPKYGDLRTLQAVQEGASLPSIAPGVDVASAIGASQAFKHITHGANNREEPIWAPRVGYVDAYNFQSGIIRYPRIAHYRHLITTAVSNYFGQNPQSSYTADERLNRETSSQKEK